MILIALLLTVALVKSAPVEKSKDQTYSPNCNLVAVSYLTVLPPSDDNDLLTINFAWDRRNDNYAKIKGTIKQYMVRHGPLEDGLFDDKSRVFFAELGKEDAITIKNVRPSKHYGIKICGLTNSSEEEVDDDFWQKAWLGEFNVADEDKYFVKQKIDNNNNFLPRCNLVDITGVAPTYIETSKSLDVSIGWMKKQSAYETVKSIDHYRVRHGPQDGWGMPIKESEAHYFDTTDDETQITLHDVRPGSHWGVQICAMQTAEDESIDWDTQAWLGSMDLSWFKTPSNGIDMPIYDLAVTDKKIPDQFTAETETPVYDVELTATPSYEMHTNSAETSDKAQEASQAQNATIAPASFVEIDE